MTLPELGMVELASTDDLLDTTMSSGVHVGAVVDMLLLTPQACDCADVAIYGLRSDYLLTLTAVDARRLASGLMSSANHTLVQELGETRSVHFGSIEIPVNTTLVTDTHMHTSSDILCLCVPLQWYPSQGVLD